MLNLEVLGSSLDYAIGAVALAQSLAATGTEHDLVCLHTWDVPEWPHLYILRRCWQLRAAPYLEPVPDVLYGDKDTSRFRYDFIKLHMMSLARVGFHLQGLCDPEPTHCCRLPRPVCTCIITLGK